MGNLFLFGALITNTSNRGGAQTGPRRDPNAMDVDRGRGGDRICYVCGK